MYEYMSFESHSYKKTILIVDKKYSIFYIIFLYDYLVGKF